MGHDRTVEREALEELLLTDGWQVFVHHLRQEWSGPGYQARMAGAFQKGDPAPRTTHEVSLEILRILQWPRDRIAALKGRTE